MVRLGKEIKESNLRTINSILTPLLGLLLLDQKFLLDLCLNAGPTVRNQEAAVGLRGIIYNQEVLRKRNNSS